MAKKRISSVDLGWLILEQLKNGRSRTPRISLAVVSDDKHRWRAVLAASSRRLMTVENQRALSAVQTGFG